jgi:Domain of unknown function (DUF6285)
MTGWERPSAAELLEAARAALLQELVGDLPERRRYLALMVANAIAIAARELEQGAEAVRADVASLADLYGEARGGPEELERLTRRLCADIRRGRFAGDGNEAALRAHLRRSAARRTAISNPKALKDD